MSTLKTVFAMQRLNRKPWIEKLEGRRLLAVTAIDDSYTLTRNGELHVGYEKAGYQSLIQLNSFRIDDAAQIEVSNRFGLMFVRNSDGKSIVVVDINTGREISKYVPNSRFTDVSLTSNDQYLFASDYFGPDLSVQTPPRGTVHRFDCSTRTWQAIGARGDAFRLEAVSDDRVLLLGGYGGGIKLFTFDVQRREMSQLSEVRTPSGNIEFDPNSNMIFVGQGYLSSSEISAYRLVADEIIPIQSTGTYGTAQMGNSDDASTVLSADGSSLFYGQLQVEASDVSNNLQLYNEKIIAASSSVAFGSKGNFYDSRDGHLLGKISFPVGTIYVPPNNRDVWISEKQSDKVHRFLLLNEKQGVLANDLTDQLKRASAKLQSNPLYGSATLYADGSFSYIPKKDFVGSDSFQYAVTGEDGAISLATVRVTISSFTTQNQAPIAPDLEFYVDRDEKLRIEQSTGAFFAGTRQIAEFPAGGNVRQIEYSAATGLLAVRNTATKVRVINPMTQRIVSERTANTVFTDMDLTPDGRYLMVADYDVAYPRNVGTNLPQPQRTFVQVYDMINNVWTVFDSATEVCRIEAISSSRVLTETCDGPVSVLWNRFSTTDGKLHPLSRFLVHDSGDVEYDNRTGRVYHTNSTHVSVLEANNDRLFKINEANIDRFSLADDRPAVLSADGKRIYSGRQQVGADYLYAPPKKLRQNIHAASGELAFGDNEIYDVVGAYIGKLDFTTDVHFVSDDSRSWWTFDPATDRLRHYSLDGVRVGLLATAQDAEGDSLTLELLDGPTNGSVSRLDTKGSVLYTPKFGFVGTDSFKYRVSDGSRSSLVRTVTVHVVDPSPVGQPPMTDDDHYVVDVGRPLTVGVDDSKTPQVRKLRDFTSQNVDGHQISVSERYGVIALASASGVQVFDLKSNAIIGSLNTNAKIVKIDMTPDERYLFVSERRIYASTSSDQPPAGTNRLHRFDAVSRQWISKNAPENSSGSFEAISRNRVFFLQGGWDDESVIYDFTDDSQTPLLEIASLLIGSEKSLLRFDKRNQRVYGGFKSGSYMTTLQISGNAQNQILPLRNDSLQDYNQFTAGKTSALSSDGGYFYLGGFQVDVSDANAKPFPLRSFPERILASTREVAVGANGFYNASNAELVQRLEQPAAFAQSDSLGTGVWIGKGQNWQKWQTVVPTGVLMNDSDSDMDILRVDLLTGPQHGVLQMRPNGAFIYTPRLGFAGTDSFTYIASSTVFVSRPTRVTIDVKGTWHNPFNGLDVDSDGNVSPLDVLVVINALNGHVGGVDGTASFLGYLDVDNDQNISPIDALLLINHLNSLSKSSYAEPSEGEARDQFFSDLIHDESDFQFSDLSADIQRRKRLLRYTHQCEHFRKKVSHFFEVFY